MGKSTAFHAETNGISGSHLISARQLIQSNLDKYPEWKTKTIFIDGLNEMRPGGGDPLLALDQIVNSIRALKIPKFRFACRFGNYLGSGGWKELGVLLEGRQIPILQLNPLNYEDIHAFISQHGVDQNDFFEHAQQYRLEALIGNPLLLNLLVKSIKKGIWPNSQFKILESACREQNPEDDDVLSPETQQSCEVFLHTAGMLSAMMLIAYKSGWAKNDPMIVRYYRCMI